MPDYDRSKLARIVAFGLQMREQLSSIESRILSYAPSVSVQEMNRAILEGSQGYSAAQLVNEEKELAALAIMEEQRQAGAVGFHVVSRFQLTPESKWQSVPFLAWGDMSIEDIRLESRRLAEQYSRDIGDETLGWMPGSAHAAVAPESVSLTYIVPIFA